MTAIARATRLVATLDRLSAQVPLLTGPCGNGRTTTLLRVRDQVGAAECQYVDVERVATTPERFLAAIVADSPFRAAPHIVPAHAKGPRAAFDACLAFLSSACTPDGRPATFLLDEVLDVRTFESFPGLRTAMPDLLAALDSSPNRFVMATRFANRAARLASLQKGGRVEVQPLPAMTAGDVRVALEETPHRLMPDHSDDDLVQTVHALTDGRAGYVCAVLDSMSSMGEHGGADPVGALVALMATGGGLASRCRFSYELRLHRARGYGALKAILGVLAEDEPLTLTIIAQRLGRTPGSTKDYLGWLEDVDLVASERKRYRISDPLLRLWIRIHGRPSPPDDDAIVREVQRYAVLRLAGAARARAAAEAATAATAPVAAGSPAEAASRQRSSGIVEFD